MEEVESLLENINKDIEGGMDEGVDFHHYTDIATGERYLWLTCALNPCRFGNQQCRKWLSIHCGGESRERARNLGLLGEREGVLRYESVD